MNGPEPADAARPGPADAIRLDAVVRQQGTFTLGPLDMTVPSGLVTGFVGPNGAGKTTAIKAMLGMVGIDAGSISVLDGAPGTRHGRIGVVLDSLALSRDWTAVSAARNLERTLGREPEVGEIADELNLAEEKVIDLIRYARDHVSLDAPVETDGDTALGDLIARETAPGPDEVVLDAEERARLDGMLSALDDRSADVVRRRYGLLDGRQAKLADIGQHWGITAERVRQIERLALAKMREYQAAA